MTASIIIRTPRPEEAFAVRRLAYLDSHRPLRGDVLVALVDDEPLAALSLADGTIVADPFHHTADVVELLRLRRAGGLRPRLPAPRACRPPRGGRPRRR